MADRLVSDATIVDQWCEATGRLRGDVPLSEVCGFARRIESLVRRMGGDGSSGQQAASTSGQPGNVGIESPGLRRHPSDSSALRREIERAMRRKCGILDDWDAREFTIEQCAAIAVELVERERRECARKLAEIGISGSPPPEGSYIQHILAEKMAAEAALAERGHVRACFCHDADCEGLYCTGNDRACLHRIMVSDPRCTPKGGTER